MTTDRPHRDDAPSSGCASTSIRGSAVDGAWLVDVLDRTQVIVESITLAVGIVAVPLLVIMVAIHSWPPALLIVAGVFVAWVGEALWALTSHGVALALVRRRPGANSTGIPGEGDEWGHVEPSVPSVEQRAERHR